jgi:hypothetical protein
MIFRIKWDSIFSYCSRSKYVATTNNLTAPTIPNEPIGNGTFTTISNTKKELINYENTA